MAHRIRFFPFTIVLLPALLLFPLSADAEGGAGVTGFPKPILLQTLIEKGILKGDGEGDYFLERTMTRGEWLSLLKRVVRERKLSILHPTASGQTVHIPPGHWASADARYWADRLIIQGDPGGNLRLDDPITVAEVLVTLNRLTDRLNLQTDGERQLLLHQGHWSYPHLNRLYQKGWIQFAEPVWKEELVPNRPILRGEAILLLEPFYSGFLPVEQTKADIAQLDHFLDQGLDVNADGKLDFSFRLNTYGYRLVPAGTGEGALSYLKEKSWRFQVIKNGVNQGELLLAFQQPATKDIAYYIRYKPMRDVPENLEIQLVSYEGENLAGRAPVAQIGEGILPGSWAEIRLKPGQSEYSYPYDGIYLEDGQKACRIGQVDVFRDLGHTVRENVTALEKPISWMIRDGNVYFTFSFPQKKETFSETWGILGNKDLWDWKDDNFSKTVLREDLNVNRKLSTDGVYYRIPFNYVPNGKNAFYRNPANVMGLKLLENIVPEQEGGQYLKDLALIIGYASLKNQNEQGFWPTGPKSKWLEGDYGIGYDYFDDRRNADNATFLLELYRRYPDERIRAALERHVQYLYTYIAEQAVPTSAEGVLLPDYTGEGTHQKTHIALNHHLAVTNFLLKWSMLTGDQQAEKAAMRLVRGVEDTAERWVKADHDLYYALYADLRPHPYPDYPLLTLEDLQQTQSLLEKTGGGGSEALQYLIDQKTLWARQKGYLQ